MVGNGLVIQKQKVFSGSDYYLLSMAEAMFEPGETTVSVNITIIDDSILEYTELFNLTMTVPNQFMDYGIKLGEIVVTIIEIYDNDGEPMYHLCCN